MTGVVMVHLIVRRDGRLDLLEIGKSSGYDLLDEAATNMVRKAQPLPPIPDRMHADRADGVLPIAFGNVSMNFKASDGTCSG
jgi:protein TonB